LHEPTALLCAVRLSPISRARFAFVDNDRLGFPSIEGIILNGRAAGRSASLIRFLSFPKRHTDQPSVFGEDRMDVDKSGLGADRFGAACESS
jgi:hypothetical protein